MLHSSKEGDKNVCNGVSFVFVGQQLLKLASPMITASKGSISNSSTYKIVLFTRLLLSVKFPTQSAFIGENMPDFVESGALITRTALYAWLVLF
jgi:hypothetical protein